MAAQSAKPRSVWPCVQTTPLGFPAVPDNWPTVLVWAAAVGQQHDLQAVTQLAVGGRDQHQAAG